MMGPRWVRYNQSKLANCAFTAALRQRSDAGALGILSGMCLPEAESGQLWGPGLGMLAMKGPARPAPLESFYDNEPTRTLLWEKSVAAIGRAFEP